MIEIKHHELKHDLKISAEGLKAPVAENSRGDFGSRQYDRDADFGNLDFCGYNNNNVSPDLRARQIIVDSYLKSEVHAHFNF